MIKKINKYILTESIKYSKGIKQIQVVKTLKNIENELIPLLRISTNNYAFIGSAGKRKNPDDKSGNLNLVLSENEIMSQNNLNKDELLNFIKTQVERLGYNVVINDELIIINWPIEGDLSETEIELIIQLTDNLNWVEFARYSPDVSNEESDYIGKYREALFVSICDNIKKNITAYFNANGVIKEYEMFVLDVNKGLFITTMSFESKNGVNKISQKITDSDKLYTDSPDEFIKIVFGDNIQLKNVSTFEECWNILNSDEFLYKKKRPRIIESFKNKLIEFRLELPEFLK